jgi:hypothetical protein
MADTTIPASSRGRAVETHLAFETTGGVLAVAGWKPVRFYNVTAGMSRARVQDDQLGVPGQNARDIGKRRKGLPGGSLRRIVPINMVEAGYWLSSGFKRAAPTGSGDDFVHAFTSGALPSNLLSLAHKWENGDFSTDIGVAMAELQISAAKTEQAARMNMTLIGLKDLPGTAWPTGTVAAAAAGDDFSDWQWRALWDGVAIGDATNVDININLGVERVNGLSGDEWPTRHHFGDIIPTGTFKLYGRAKTFRDLSGGDTSGTLTLEAVDPLDANRYLRIEQANVQFDTPQNEVSGGGQLSADFTYGAAQDADTPAVTITLGNGVATY